ncbi:MAG: hypothetical protein HY825_20280 [Acidobacteria bacterium]|nr:hypothetical protein [Acidobacteriota bacterium]
MHPIRLSRFLATGASLVALGAAVDCKSGFEPEGTGGAGASSTGGGGPECWTPAECPGVDTICGIRTCDDGVCGVNAAPASTACGQNGGTVCDGLGTCVECVGNVDCGPTTECSGHVCVPTPCFDGLQNGDETDIDCGGATCDPCAPGAVCLLPSDCASAVCTGTCQAAICGDGVVNDPAEECDGDGAGTGGETVTCDGDCTFVSCGDGHVNPLVNEACDDGNTVTGDGCGQCQYIVAITAGGAHSCVLLSNGHVKCWGDNADGQLGLGDTAHRGDGAGEMGDALPAVELGAGRTATAVVAGGQHTCARLDDDTLKCWGRGDAGELGLGGTGNQGDQPGQMGDILATVDLGTGLTAAAVVLGDYHSCARIGTGGVKCWGNNIWGQLGLGDVERRGDGLGEMGDSLPFVNLGAVVSPSQISARWDSTCVRFPAGTVKCWGSNPAGQLGLGDTNDRGDVPGEMGVNLPYVALGTGRTAVSVVTGSHTCALLDNAALKCWGTNSNGELGLGDVARRGDGPGEMGDALPYVSLGSARSAVAVGLGQYHSCALLDDASVKCWGSGSTGLIGSGSTSNLGDQPGEMGDSLAPVALGTGRTALQLAVGPYHTCVLLDDRTVKCWGRNGSGRLGLGDTTDRGSGASQMGDNLPTVLLP